MGFFTIVGAVIGGIIGAIGGALSLHDRYVKSRPIASLTSIMQGSQKLLAWNSMATDSANGAFAN
jgi:hypothetical protein